MKEFHCGDVVKGCTARFQAQDENGILQAVAEHARKDHGLAEVPMELVIQVRAMIHESHLESVAA